MTTIRRTRLPRSRPADVESGLPGIPVTAPADAGDDDGDDVRLALIDPPAERTTLDGAWWPRTRSLTGELPALVEELHRRGIRVTRAAYNPDGWDPAPRRLAADGRIIRLGWFRSIDPQLLNLTGDFTRGRIDLLVVPPDTRRSRPSSLHRGHRTNQPADPQCTARRSAAGRAGGAAPAARR